MKKEPKLDENDNPITPHKTDGSNLKPTHLRIEGPVGNCHRDRRLNSNITLLRFVKHADSRDRLEPNEYFARMEYDASRSTPMNIDGETGLDHLGPGGRFVISKRYTSVWLPIGKMCVVRVDNPDLCFIMI